MLLLSNKNNCDPDASFSTKKTVFENEQYHEKLSVFSPIKEALWSALCPLIYKFLISN